MKPAPPLMRIRSGNAGRVTEAPADETKRCLGCIYDYDNRRLFQASKRRAYRRLQTYESAERSTNAAGNILDGRAVETPRIRHRNLWLRGSTECRPPERDR